MPFSSSSTSWLVQANKSLGLLFAVVVLSPNYYQDLNNIIEHSLIKKYLNAYVILLLLLFLASLFLPFVSLNLFASLMLFYVPGSDLRSCFHPTFLDPEVGDHIVTVKLSLIAGTWSMLL